MGEKKKKDKSPKTPKVGVAVFLFKENTCSNTNRDLGKIKVLLGKRLGKHGSREWSPPGGHVEFMEDPVDTCQRETKEETNLSMRKLRRVTSVPYTNDVFKETGKHYITLFFTADVDREEDLVNVEKDKFEEWQWFKLNELPFPLFGPARKILNDPDFLNEAVEHHL